MDKSKKLCETCRFFAKSGSKGYCHRYPPQACIVDEQGTSATLYRIPEVHEAGYCGEWQEGVQDALAEELEISSYSPKK